MDDSSNRPVGGCYGAVRPAWRPEGKHFQDLPELLTGAKPSTHTDLGPSFLQGYERLALCDYQLLSCQQWL